MIKGRKAQEEIVGFAIIVVIVSLIVVFFLVFSLSDEGKRESYEASSFLQSMLYHTTSCEIGSELLSVQELIVSCHREERCLNREEDACIVLNQTLQGILEESWSVGPDFPVKGYDFKISSGEEEILFTRAGNSTGNYKGSQQIVPSSGTSVNVAFTVYS